jgi:serine protease Do
MRMVVSRRLVRNLILPALALGIAWPAAPRASELPASQADMVAKLLPEVVNISIEKLVKTAAVPSGNRASQASFTRKQSLGSGFIIDSSGIIVTNNHVIDGAESITVILQDNTRLHATPIFKAPIDMALLKVTYGKPLPAIKWGDSDAMRPGDDVIAIGNPLGLGSSVTAGIVSALDRDIKETPFDSFIQTDAAINHGNSGGPLFNSAGEVIGINTALFTPDGDGGSIGLGFAIPGNDAQFILNTMKQYGRLKFGWLGAELQELGPEAADALGMPLNDGAIITSVTPKGSAEEAGLRGGDVIMKIDNKPIPTVRTLNRIMVSSTVGSAVPVLLWRDGAVQTVQLTVEEAPSTSPGNTMQIAAKAKMMPMPVHVERHDLGLGMAALTDELRKKFGIPAGQSGVVVTSVTANSVASERGIVPGNLITKVQLKPVSTPEDVNKIVDWAWDTRHPHILLLFQDDNSIRYVPLPVGTNPQG